MALRSSMLSALVIVATLTVPLGLAGVPGLGDAVGAGAGPTGGALPEGLPPVEPGHQPCQPGVGCLDFPVWVDEGGDTMTGDLRMESDVIMSPASGPASAGPVPQILLQNGTRILLEPGTQINLTTGGVLTPEGHAFTAPLFMSADLTLEDGTTLVVRKGAAVRFEEAIGFVGVGTIGTTAEEPFLLLVNNETALRIEPTGATVSVVAGNESNEVAAGTAGAVVAGGGSADEPNRAAGDFSTVAGGRGNTADGNYSFAAGRGAGALHPGAFVWADAAGDAFTSTGDNQFLIRAAGNVGVDTSDPAEKLTVAGNVAPAANDTHTLGTSALRWSALFLGSDIDYASELRWRHGGETAMTLTTGGDLTTSGTVVADALSGVFTGTLADGTVSAASLQAGAVGTAQLADDAVTAAKIGESCASGHVLKSDGSGWACAVDEDTTYDAGAGLTLAGTTFAVDTAAVQSRVSSSCATGSAIRVVNADGTVSCETDDDAGGDVTAVTAGSGLTGGGAGGELTLGIDTMGVTAAHLAPDSVGPEEIQANAVGPSEISDGGVAFEDLADGAVSGAKLATGAVTTSKISDGTILFADVGQNGCTTNQIIRWSGTQWVCAAQGTANADTLDGFDSGQFLRSDTADTYDGALLTVATDLRVDGLLSLDEAGTSAWPAAFSRLGVTDGTGAVRGTGQSGVVKGYLGVRAADNFDGLASADWSSELIGVAGVTTTDSSFVDYGVKGHGHQVGVRGEYAPNPDVDYAELGKSGVGLEAKGSSLAAKFLAPVSVEGASGADDDFVYFDDGSAEWLEWNDNAQRFDFSDDLYVPGQVGAQETPTASWPGAFTQPGSTSGTGAVRGTGQASVPRGYLGVRGADNFDGLGSADWATEFIGVAGVTTVDSSLVDYGVKGHGHQVGVRGEYASNPDVDYAELGKSGVGLEAKGSSRAAKFLAPVSVEGASDVDNDFVYFDDGSSEWIEWDDNAQRFQLSDDLHVTGTLAAQETPTASWPAAITQSGSTDGTGAVRATGQAGVPKGYMAIRGGDNLDGLATADWASEFIGVAGVTTVDSSLVDYGVKGHGHNVGVRGEYASNPDVDYAELGKSGVGLEAKGSSRAAKFLAPVSVEGASAADDDSVYFDDGTTESLSWKDASGRFEFSDDLHVFGDVSATSKSFVQPHPTDPTKAIWYASLEGPEAGIYWRGSGRLVDGVARVDFPEEFRLVLSEDVPVTAYVTLTEDANGVFVKEKAADHIVVKETGGGTSDAAFDVVVYGVRAGYEQFQVVRDAIPGP